MTHGELSHRDALVIGGNMAGLTVGYLLGSYGLHTTLIERAARVGGIDGSFTNERGRRFDFGVHALDHGRNEFVSRLLERAVEGRFRRLPKQRALLLRGHVFPYNSPPEDWPTELRALLKPGRIVDDLGGAPPTRARLGAVYGPKFADFVFDEVLVSYPAEDAQRRYGVDESALLANIYPWFFPRVERGARADTAHHRYQSRVRAEGGEYVIYPAEGGFQGFADGLARMAQRAGVELVTGAGDLELVMDDARRAVVEVRADGRRFAADRVYWCGPATPLMQLLGEPAFDANPESFALGSLQFERPVTCEYLELIAGDPRHLVKRASFPGKLQGGPDDLVQLEYHYPKGADGYSQAPEFWLERWLTSLREVGLVQPDNEVVAFDLKHFPIHYNAFGIEGRPTPEVVLPPLPPTSNLRPVLPTYRRINLNTRLPQYLEFLAKDLSRS